MTMVKDSIETLNQQNNRITYSRGRLIKGVTTNQSIPTIPSKFQTVVTDNSDRKGFGQTSKRFHFEKTDVPGPGSYITHQNLSDALRRVSDSKKGYGNLASSASRDENERKLNRFVTPGAGTYEVEDTKRHDFNRGVTHQFAKPIVNEQHNQQQTSSKPGPMDYDVSKASKFKFKSNNVSADAAFKSNTKRETQFTEVSKCSVPAPGTYNVNLEQSSSKVPLSSFKSGTKRGAFTPLGHTPGPAHYRPNEPLAEHINRTILPRKHYLAISAPAIPLAPELPMPGPGAYEVRDFKEPEKKYMSSAVFVSCTSRWTSGGVVGGDTSGDRELPGPTNYSPEKPIKQSFHYNLGGKWIV